MDIDLDEIYRIVCILRRGHEPPDGAAITSATAWGPALDSDGFEKWEGRLGRACRGVKKACET